MTWRSALFLGATATKGSGLNRMASCDASGSVCLGRSGFNRALASRWRACSPSPRASMRQIMPMTWTTVPYHRDL